ncbi:MAG: iron-sulfur cluster repair di-iron protein [Bacteroidales bacterium]
MNNTSFGQLQVGEIVANDFRTSRVFKDLGIDFCCGGKVSVESVCQGLGINMSELEQKIEAIKSTEAKHQHNYNEWELSFLADYIVNMHHSYVNSTLPELVFYTNKIAEVHGDNHPELLEVAQLTNEVNRELLQHLKQEEEVLFPAIKSQLSNPSAQTADTIKNEITRMLGEHDFAGSTFERIDKLTSGYKVPEDACNTYRVALGTLKEFEDDLHTHVHLENNILFPKSLEL